MKKMTIVGLVLIVLAVVSWVIAALVPISAENFFGMAFSGLGTCGVVVLIIAAILNILNLVKK